MLTDYYRMYKKRGFIKILKYFYEAHLYDLIYNINTHKKNKDKNFSNDSLIIERKIENYITYQVSWTTEIIKVFNYLYKYLNKNSPIFKKFTFVDVGSGKGKVLIVWYRMIRKFKLEQKIIGVEINTGFHKLAKKNISKLGLQKKIILASKGVLKYKFTKKNYILYLFNPFSLIILKKLISKLKKKNIILIYVNPKFHTLLKKEKFKKIYEFKNKNYNICNIKIYLRNVKI